MGEVTIPHPISNFVFSRVYLQSKYGKWLEKNGKETSIQGLKYTR